jgi:hypothetical protein
MTSFLVATWEGAEEIMMYVTPAPAHIRRHAARQADPGAVVSSMTAARKVKMIVGRGPM